MLKLATTPLISALRPTLSFELLNNGINVHLAFLARLWLVEYQCLQRFLVVKKLSHHHCSQVGHRVETGFRQA